MYMYIYIHINIYTYTYINIPTHTYMYIYIYICIYIHRYIYVYTHHPNIARYHTCTDLCIHMYIHRSENKFVYINTQMYTCIYICITYKYIYVHP